MEVRILGPIEVRSSGNPIDAGPSRQLAVLAVLAVEAGRTVSPDALLDRVWGDNPPRRVRHNLHVYISRIRQVLAAAGAPGTVVRGPGGYSLDLPAEAIDAGRFRDLVSRADGSPDLLGEALELFRGEPLAGLTGEWAAREREAWQRRYVEASLQWAAAKQQAGDMSGVVESLLRLSAAHPYDEAVAARLLRVLNASGQRARALDHYQVVRTTLAEELGTEPGAELRQLHQQLLRDEPAAPAPRRGPALLPPDAYGFIGREPHLARLDETLTRVADQPTAMPICVVTGPPGVGKTTLAVHWAHRVRDRFPDGQLYLDLRGFGPGSSALTTGQAVRRFLDALGVASRRVPADVDAQLDLYRSEMAGRRALVLLDNAHDVEQVRPLLPGSSGTVVVVTSRRRLTGLVAADGAWPVPVDVFSDAESRQFLLRRIDDGRADADPVAVAELTARCGRLPLALAMVAARAVLEPSFSIAELTTDLARPGERLDALDLRSVFARSYAALDPAAARLFTLLGAWSEPEITLAAVASVAGEPEAEARRTLGRLGEAHLVAERPRSRWVLHDLLLEYAGELPLADEDRRAALHRGFQHLLHTAVAADLALNPHIEPAPLVPARAGVVVEPIATKNEAFDWFNRELTGLLTAIERGERTPGFTEYVPPLAEALCTFLHRNGYWTEQARVQMAVLRTARRLGEPALEARAHLRLAHALTTGRDGEAEEHYLAAIDLYRGCGDIDGQAQAHRHLGWLYETRERYAEALDQAERALELASAAGSDRSLAEALNSVGWHNLLLGRLSGAVDFCERAVELHRRLGSRAGEAAALDSIGFAYHRQGRQPDAIRYYEQSLALFRAVGARLDEAEVLDHLGDAHVAAGSTEAARAAWREAATILDSLGQDWAEVVRAKITD
ncbi:BTAD domain-containing putative transcriptional regulator [Micromonospora sp. NPDC006766]|uniref:AfsR/SARP family transcriptional regulator n=1 Tax=Micromonospora sp. NPDC006766 TaxID=3154778 RepID=UPI0033CE4A4D